jgi:hypothetical protein
MVRICDTRLYGEAENEEFAIREWSQREANYAELSKEASAVHGFFWLGQKIE